MHNKEWCKCQNDINHTFTCPQEIEHLEETASETLQSLRHCLSLFEQQEEVSNMPVSILGEGGGRRKEIDSGCVNEVQSIS